MGSAASISLMFSSVYYSKHVVTACDVACIRTRDVAFLNTLQGNNADNLYLGYATLLETRGEI